MNRIEETIRARRAQGQGAFMPFLVIGDPDLETSLRLTGALVEAGADVLEFGFAFSDPPADGPVIQAADLRALEAGVKPPLAFEFLAEVKRRWDKPAALLMYHNLILQYGVEAFYQKCRAVGVDAVLVADVPLEESEVIVAAAKAAEVAPIFIASALTSDARLARLAQVATEGYLYAVARIGITGEQHGVDPALEATLARFGAAVRVPVLAGFGISTPEHARAVMRAGADGVICGSAIVRRIAASLDDGNKMIEDVGRFAGAMAAAARQG